MRSLAVMLIGGWLLLLAAPGASASCGAEPRDQAASSPIAFVGTVSEVRGTRAQINVEAVWRGPDVAPVVWVQGGMEDSPLSFMGASTSVDMQWELGRRYLIGAQEADLRTDNCSSVLLEAGDAAAIASGDTRPPVAGGVGGAGPVADPFVWLLSALAVLLAATAGAAVYLARR